jgi:hypothetical protein
VASSQMAIRSLRQVAGAYASTRRDYARRVQAEAKRKASCEAKGWMYKPRQIKLVGLCEFTRPAAMFLMALCRWVST